MKAYIIGEAGSCHEGNLELAKKLIDMVKDASADAVKFQYYHSGAAVAERREAPQFAEMYERYRMPADWLPYLHHHATILGLDFLCTTYMEDDIEVVAPYVPAFKIASLEAMNTAFIEKHLQYGKPIYISTGVLTHDELLRLVALRSQHRQIRLLHCVSAYPCPPEQVHLSVIRRYGLDGFSDHTGHPCMGALAYMEGARIFEAHIRHERTSEKNPDYPHALGRLHWLEYTRNIRTAELALGTNTKETQPDEAVYRQYMS